MPDGHDHEAEIADARARVGRAIRDLGHAFVGHVADTADLDRLVDELERRTAALRTGTPRERSVDRPTGDWGPGPADGEEMTSFDDRPVSGRSSPHGLDVRVVRDGDEVVASVTLGAAHEGAPGRSHGGIIAALFDDIFGFLLVVHGQPAFTGELGVRYAAGVPLHRPLECRVRVTGRDGRKLHMTGELTGEPAGHPAEPADAERIEYTTARATFITFDPETWAALSGVT